MANRRIAYVVNHVAFFVSHRLPLAVGAKRAGFEVALFTGQAGSSSMEKLAEIELTESGVLHERVAFRSDGLHPFVELWGLAQLVRVLWRYQPELVHCVSPKGVLYGGIAARICGAKGIVLAISGMGYAFTGTGDRSLVRSLVKRVYLMLVRYVYRHPNVRVIVQNQDDRSTLIHSGLTKAEQLTLIPGSGVQLGDFSNCSPANKKHMVLLPARMLRDKGVEEFVEAARRLKCILPDWRFVLAGAADYHNPSAIPSNQIKAWEQDGVVEWRGHVDYMVPLFSEAAIVCLPSYREGMPKSLLEAAAAGCAIVTTDVTGCREAILPGITGDLVPVCDSEALANVILALIREPERRMAYGMAGQKLASDRFSIDAVVDKTVGIYQELTKNA